MYLRDLAVYAADAAVLLANYTLRDFNSSTHTPVEAYLDQLGRRKVVLGDLAKVNVEVGARRPGGPTYFAALNSVVATLRLRPLCSPFAGGAAVAHHRGAAQGAAADRKAHRLGHSLVRKCADGPEPARVSSA